MAESVCKGRNQSAFGEARATTECSVLAGQMVPLLGRGACHRALTVPHIEQYGDLVGFSDCRIATIDAASRLTKNLGGGMIGDGLIEVFRRK